jgi:hypothetical protein
MPDDSISTSGGREAYQTTGMLIDQGFDGGGLERFTQDGIPDTAIAIIVELFLGI